MADMTTQATWENGAAKAARSVLDVTGDGLALGALSSSLLDEIERYLTMLRDSTPNVDLWEFIADDALQAFAAIETPFFGVSRKGLLEEIVDTIITKQHDYGHDNILWGGVEGIVLRMHDKTARIRNLQERGHHGFTTGAPINEPLADSWLDLVGYALIGIMLRDGTFNFPLARDVITDAVCVDDEQEWNDVEATPPDRDCFTLPDGECVAEPCSLHDDDFFLPEDFFDDEDTYDELYDPTMWHLATHSQNVFVGTYLWGFDDGAPRVGVFAKGKNEGADKDATGAYYTPDELAALIDYLMMTHALMEAYVVHAEAADAIDTLAPHVVVAP